MFAKICWNGSKALIYLIKDLSTFQNQINLLESSSDYINSFFSWIQGCIFLWIWIQCTYGSLKMYLSPCFFVHDPLWVIFCRSIRTASLSPYSNHFPDHESGRSQTYPERKNKWIYYLQNCTWCFWYWTEPYSVM